LGCSELPAGPEELSGALRFNVAVAIEGVFCVDEVPDTLAGACIGVPATDPGVAADAGFVFAGFGGEFCVDTVAGTSFGDGVGALCIVEVDGGPDGDE
jgi:hypothetical protein